MAARKLQTEIDRTLKKVSEGVEQFEEQYQKIQQTTNPAHKEKIESELKTQIKKLQRLRDQIKTWLASNDIKDKKALTDNRKLIETQMERFKACEKEMKTKAFSKEGLSAGHRLDPKEQQKMETTSFISGQVDELSRQVEATEAEIEQLQGGTKKSKKGAASNADRVATLEGQNDRRNWHVSRLELINRLIENGNLDPERVQGLKEDITYFVDSNTDEDFEEDEGIYDELNLEEEEDAFGMGGDDVQSSHDSMSLADTSDIGSHVAPAPAPVRTPAKKETKSQPTPKDKEEAADDKSPTQAKAKTGTAARKPTLDGTAQRPTGLAPPSRSTSGTSAAASSTAKDPVPPVPAPRAVPTVLPPIRYSAAAASAVSAPTQATANASSQPAVQSPAAATTSVASPSTTTAPSIMSPTSVTSPPTTAPTSAAKAPAALSPEVQKARLPTPGVAVPSSTDTSPSVAPSQATAASTAQGTLSPSPQPQQLDQSQVLSPSQQAASLAPLQALEVGSQPQQQQPIGRASSDDKTGIPMSDEPAPSQVSPSQQATGLQGPGTIGSGAAGSEPRLPSSLADLVTSFESAKQKSLRRDNDLGEVQSILEAGYPNIPQPADAEKPKYYIPRNPYPTPHYYPQQPSPHLANANLFAKFDVDTLFYIFYYCQGTYMQYLAAQELKKQSWRFHKQYLTWFQRANEPQTITDEYEQGVYLYFDFEGSWAQRRKENFSFYYRHLEE